MQRLTRTGDVWRAGRIEVTLAPTPAGARVRLSAPDDSLLRIHLRWRGRMTAARLVLGDAWERGYGDLEWRGIVPDRIEFWTRDPHRLHDRVLYERRDGGAWVRSLLFP